MFQKLKEKLKNSLSIFSKKAKEAVQEAPKEELPQTEQKTQEPLIKKTQIPKPHAVKKERSLPPQAVTTKIQEPRPIAKEPEQKEIQEPKKSIFSRAKEIFTTRTLSEEKFDELFWNLELLLLENNVAVDVTRKIRDALKEQLVNKPLPRDLESVVSNTLKASLDSVLSTEKIDILTHHKKPLIIAFFGINGSGKTTTIAKVANLFQQHKKTCVMAAGDTFRAAAIQQLEEHAQNLNIKLIKHDYGADAAAVAFDAVKFAQKNAIDVVLIDTAGRLHSDSNLMDELKKIIRVAKPDIKIFVGESITGNDCITQAADFDALIGIDGIILTKADVDEKGGTALSISYMTKKPILYIGTGQKYTDLQPFTKEFVMKNLGLA
jgi:fused signal recognition particle receptor